jgi:hypothetical protein
LKTKSQKQAEAIERNAQYRDKYLKQAEDRGLVGFDAKEFADRKQGVPLKQTLKSYQY